MFLTERTGFLLELREINKGLEVGVGSLMVVCRHCAYFPSIFLIKQKGAHPW